MMDCKVVRNAIGIDGFVGHKKKEMRRDVICVDRLVLPVLGTN